MEPPRVPPAAGKPNRTRLPSASTSCAWRPAVLPKNSTSEPSRMLLKAGSVLASCSERTGTSTRSNRSSAPGALTAVTGRTVRWPDPAS
jgi:hypothetical protein